MDTRKRLSKVETVVAEHAATSHLDSLERAGCDRDRIVGLLELDFLADDSWKMLAGMDLRALKANLAKIKECAKVIDRLNRTELVYSGVFGPGEPYFAQIHQSPTLSERLHEYAKKIESLLRFQGPAHKIRSHVWKARFVAIVMESTGKAHDPEVSSIVAAILNRPKYSEKAHRAWRLRYPSIIENERVRERTRLDRQLLKPPRHI